MKYLITALLLFGCCADKESKDEHWHVKWGRQQAMTPSYYRKVCIDGVTYLETKTGPDGHALTVQLGKAATVVACP